MLSRVADALYWMARYVERAEHGARVLDVTQGTLIDVQDVDPDRARRYRSGALEQLGLSEDVEWNAAIFDDQLASSIASSLGRARENARQVREIISPEMWDGLNRAYWALHRPATSRPREEFLSGALEDVIRASFLWGGVTDATMSRDMGWLFIRLGQFVERIHRTAVTFSSLWRDIEESANREPRAEDNIGRLLLLRCCGCLQEYRKMNPTRFDSRRIVGFLLLEPTFPRTLRYSTEVAASFSERLAASVGPRGAATQRAFGRLAAEVEYVELDELIHGGPRTLLDATFTQLGRATLELQRAYFLH